MKCSLCGSNMVRKVTFVKAKVDKSKPKPRKPELEEIIFYECPECENAVLEDKIKGNKR